jgi:hypothetical protein
MGAGVRSGEKEVGKKSLKNFVRMKKVVNFADPKRTRIGIFG